MSAGFDLLQRKPRLVVAGGREQSRSRPYSLFSGQMTIIRLILIRLPLDHLHRVQAAFHSMGQVERLFFKPGDHRGARNPKCSLEPTQTATLFVCTQNLFSALLWIGMRGGIFSAIPLPCMTAVSLLSMGCRPVTHYFSAFTGGTQNGDGNHAHFS